MGFTWGRFSRKQLVSIAQSDARLNIWQGSVRSGKTIASIVRWLEFVETAPPGDLLMAGKTERTLKRNVLDVIERILGPERYRYNKGEGEVYICGRRIYVAGANDERAEGKIRGMTLAGAYGDEVTLWPESFFRMLLSRLSIPGAKLFATTNPDSPYHWLKRDFLDKQGLNLKSWHFTLDDNLNLDPEYIAALKQEYTGLWYKRFILGLWVQAEGAVYDMFDEAVHVVDKTPDEYDEPKRYDRLYVGVDYGTHNPTAFILVGQVKDTFYVVDEYYYDSAARGRQKTDAEYSRDLREFLSGRRPNAIIIDPSAASFIAQLRRDGVGPIRKADNDVLAGIRTVANLLSQCRLYIHRRAQNLLREIAGYIWDDQAQKRGEDKPLKQNDHALDALRYALHTMVGRGPAISFD